jgi:hypothetical protein
MPDALVSVHNRCLATDHREHIAFRADGRAALASDAMGWIDVWMLSFRSLGKQISFLCGLAGSLRASSLALQVENHRHGQN